MSVSELAKPINFFFVNLASLIDSSPKVTSKWMPRRFVLLPKRVPFTSSTIFDLLSQAWQLLEPELSSHSSWLSTKQAIRIDNLQTHIILKSDYTSPMQLTSKIKHYTSTPLIYENTCMYNTTYSPHTETDTLTTLTQQHLGYLLDLSISPC